MGNAVLVIGPLAVIAVIVIIVRMLNGRGGPRT